MKLSIFSILFWVSISHLMASDSPRQPNIVIICADDLGYNDLGCYAYPFVGDAQPSPFPEDTAYAAPNQAIGLVNGKRVSLTPQIDRLAAQGIKLTDYQAPAFCCTPSRAGLLTGMAPPRLGFNGIISETRKDTYGLSSREVTLAEALKGAGYATAGFGKWHLGSIPQHDPTRHGFDQFPLSDGADKFGLETITKQCLAFISAHKDGPFFAYFAPHQPHIPVVAHPDFVGASEALLGKRTYLKGDGTTATESTASSFHDVICELDARVGEILAKLDELDLASHTVVIFTSDNGPWHGSKIAQKPGHIGSGYPYRGGKFDLWEGATRVPAIIRFPGKIQPGIIRDGLVSGLDWFPTLVKLGGGTLPTNHALDGVDLWPYLTDATQSTSPRPFNAHFSGLKVQAIDDGHYKLIKDKLIDLTKDCTETIDCSTEHPEIATSFIRQLAIANEHLAADMRGYQNFSDQDIDLHVGTSPYVEATPSKPGAFSLRLTNAPSAPITVTVAQRSGCKQLTIHPSSVTFTAANWSEPQSMTVEATNEHDVGESDYATFIAEGLPTMPIREIYLHRQR